MGFAAWLSTRVAMGLISVFSAVAIAPNLKGHTAPHAGASWMSMVQPWTNWDGALYIKIASHGYTTKDWTAFFPLFPLLIRFAAGIVHHLFAPISPPISAYPWTLASVLVSNGSLLVALVSIALLVLLETKDRGLTAFVLLLVLGYPVAFYLSAGYTESTTLALVSLTLLCARRGLWIPAGITGGLAALTHDQNVLLALVIAIEFARQHSWLSVAGWREARVSLRLTEVAGGIAGTLAPFAGLGLYVAYLWHRFGSPLLFVEVERSGWGRQPVPPWQTFQFLVDAIRGTTGTATVWQLLAGLDGGLLVVFLLIIVLTVRRLPLSLTVYGGISVLASLIVVVPHGADPLLGTGRYLVAATVPVFLGLALLLEKRHGTLAGIISFSFLLQGVLLVWWLVGMFVE